MYMMIISITSDHTVYCYCCCYCHMPYYTMLTPLPSACPAPLRAPCQAAEDVAIKLEAELTQARVRMTQLDGQLRAKEKEHERLQVRCTHLLMRHSELHTCTHAATCSHIIPSPPVTLQDYLKATRSSEYEAYVKTGKAEEGGRKLEADLTTTRLRLVQLEAGAGRAGHGDGGKSCRLVQGGQGRGGGCYWTVLTDRKSVV